MDTSPLFEFSDRAKLRQWLEENHGTTPFCWVATTRSKEPRCGAIPYLEVVEECLCFGWIDSTLKRLDEGRQAQRISPRKSGSTWTILNSRRFLDLAERGLVTEAGWKAFREAGRLVRVHAGLFLLGRVPGAHQSLHLPQRDSGSSTPVTSCARKISTTWISCPR